MTRHRPTCAGVIRGLVIAVTGRTDREEREAPPCRGQAPVPGARK